MLLFHATLTTTSTTTATRTISKLRLTIRCFSSTSVHSSSTKWPTLPVLTDPSPASFRKTAFLPARPFKIPRAAFTPPLPAIEKWFSPANASSSISRTSSSLSSSDSTDTATDHDNDNNSISISIPNYTYLDPFASTTILPLELITDDNEYNNSDGSLFKKKFARASAPLAIWLSWSKLVLLDPSTTTTPISQHHHHHQPPNLYISQSPLSLLPQPLQSDLPTPHFILTAGKGDIYDSSLWMGVPPTYTPLHRDGNPNVLVQLAGGKTVRLMQPDYDDDDGKGIGRWIRGIGMNESAMQGDERVRMERLVWGDDENHDHDHDWQGDRKGQGDKTGKEDGKGKERYEVQLQPGEAVFIPTGWWHSVQGTGRGVTASVNWWFR